MIQLETAAGAAIKHFHNAHGINVPRSRFLPVKSCSDLFAVQSDLYKLENGELKRDAHDPIATAPIVKLSDHFKKVSTSNSFSNVSAFSLGSKFSRSLQDDSAYFGVGSFERVGRCLLWIECDAQGWWGIGAL